MKPTPPKRVGRPRKIKILEKEPNHEHHSGIKTPKKVGRPRKTAISLEKKDNLDIDLGSKDLKDNDLNIEDS